MEPHCAAACSHLCDCMFVYVYAGMSVNCLNLHGNDVPPSQTPARIREGKKQGVSFLSKNGKNIRCWCTKKNQTHEEYLAQSDFFSDLGCSFLSEVMVTNDSDKMAFVSSENLSFFPKINIRFHIRTRHKLWLSNRLQESLRGSKMTCSFISGYTLLILQVKVYTIGTTVLKMV